MTEAEIITALKAKLSVPTGRHLYGVLGTYPALDAFARKLQQARLSDTGRFPKPLSVNNGILGIIPEDEFRLLVEDEAKRPEPTAKHVEQAFGTFLRDALQAKGMVVLTGLEMLFAYGIDLSPLRVLATDDHRVILLLPACREGGRVRLYPHLSDAEVYLPDKLIADNNLFELK